MKDKAKKFWNFKEAEGGNPAELILYGEISEASWWGDEVTPKMFNEDLKALGDVDNIVVRINSGGGDIFAAAAIYTRLKEHKANITVKIDGWAASAATTIAMAGDKVEIANNAIFMIHDPLFGLFGYYNAKDMAKMQEELEIIKKGIVAAYQLRTGKTEEEISELMSAETWYTAQEAIDNGFADSLMFEVSANAVINSGAVNVNGVKIAASNYKIPNEILNLCQNHANGKDFNIKTKNNEEQKGDKPMEEIKTVEELKEAYPELVKQIEEAAKEEERNRIKEIEEIAEPGAEDVVNAAKFETFEKAGDVAIKILNAKKQAGKNYLQNREKDVQNSGMNGVEPTPAPTGPKEDEYQTAIEKAYPKTK